MKLFILIFSVIFCQDIFCQDVLLQYNNKILTHNGVPIKNHVYRPDLDGDCAYSLFASGFEKVGDDWYVVNRGDSGDVRLGYSYALWATGSGVYINSGLQPTQNGIIEVSGIWRSSSATKVLAGCNDASSNYFQVGINNENKPFATLGSTTVTSATALVNATYHTLRWEWESDSLHIYVDGVLSISDAWTGTLPAVNYFYFANSNNGSVQANTYSSGFFFDLKIYNNSKTLIRYYPLQEGNGTKVFDIVSNATLTLAGTLGSKANVPNSLYYALGGWQKYSYHNLFYGWTDTTISGNNKIRIPGRLNKTTSATGSAITYLAGDWHNRCETFIILPYQRTGNSLYSSYRIVSSLVNDDYSWHPLEMDVNEMNIERVLQNRTFIKKTGTTKLTDVVIYASTLTASELRNAQRYSGNMINTYDSFLRNYSQGLAASNDTVYIGSDPFQLNSEQVNGKGVIAYRNDTAVKIYGIAQIYDASPIILTTKSGIKVWIASASGSGKVTAYNVATAAKVWESTVTLADNSRLGFNYYTKDNGEKLIFCNANAKYVYAINSETGVNEYTLTGIGSSGITVAIDQTNKVGYYQSDSTIIKFRCENGSTVRSVYLSSGLTDASIGNCIFTNDAHGSYVATFWYKYNDWCTVRVYDTTLTLAWTETQLSISYKGSIAYYDGYVIAGGGDIWATSPTSFLIKSFDITSGAVRWTYNPELVQANLQGFDHQIIADGYIYTENANSGGHSQPYLWELDVTTGLLTNRWKMDYNIMSSCGVAMVYDGYYYSGTLADINKTTKMPVSATTKVDWSQVWFNQGNHLSY